MQTVFDEKDQLDSFSTNININMFHNYRKANFSYRDDDFVYQFQTSSKLPSSSNYYCDGQSEQTNKRCAVSPYLKQKKGE
jgi:hypothetical protein